MPNLTDDVKAFIVKRLACYDTPSQVVRLVKTHFDIEVTRQHVYAYDPEASQQMSPRWSELHAATRAAFVREFAGIAIAQKAVRLRMLDRMARHAEENQHFMRTVLLLEQAAKECGGAYERQRRSAAPEGPAT